MPGEQAERIPTKPPGRDLGCSWWSKRDLHLTFNAFNFFKKGKHIHVFSKTEKGKKILKHRKNNYGNGGKKD